MENTNRDRLNWLLAGLVTLVAFIVYFRTMAVSVSLWDCGEFIACSRILGIAHPPGTPLFIIFGRVFSMLSFLGNDIAHRITFVSVLSSAFSAGFAYLTVSKIISWWLKEKESFVDRLPMYIGGIVGALFMAFSRTWWTNAVEAEVYGLTLLTSIVAVYLSLVWYEKREQPGSDKYLFLMIFIAMLGVGAHLAAFIVVPAIFLFLLLASPRLLKEPRVWVSMLCGLVLLVAYDYFLWATFIWLVVCIISALGRKDFDWTWMVVFVAFVALSLIIKQRAPEAFVWFAVIGLGAFVIRTFTGYSTGSRLWQSLFAVFAIASLIIMDISMELMVWINLIGLPIFLVVAFKTKSYYWRWAMVFTTMMALAFSVQYTVLVRSQHRPRINMTKPDTLTRMNDYLARKQYGQGNMITRMFDRRGELANQFGDYPRMGMLGFWEKQYSNSGIFFLWLFVGLWGLYYAMKTRWKSGLMIFLIVLAGTIGITFYMNFADGTQVMEDPNARLEVRDRDYFWTHGFGMFGWAIGLGIAGFLHSLLMYLRSRKGTQKFIVPVSLLFSLTIFLPAFAIAENYNYNDRSNEWLPYQFGRDMLMACDTNAILFTAGDNDTYPLWALQEAYGFRQDVKIINLSLANVDWYVLHCKEVFGAPMAIESDQIEVKEIRTERGLERRPEKMYTDPFIGARTYFGSRPRYNQEGQQVGLIEMAQLTIEKVIEASLMAGGSTGNIFSPSEGDTLIMEYPVYFTSLSEPVRNIRFRNQYRHLERVTNLYKIKDTVIVGVTPPPAGPEPFTYNINRSHELLTDVFIFDGMGDPEYARGEFTAMMVHRYYASEYDMIIDSLVGRSDTSRLSELLDVAIQNTPEHPDWPEWKAIRDSLEGVPESKLTEYQQEYVDYMNKLIQIHPYNFYYRQFVSEVLFDMDRMTEDGSEYTLQALEILEEGVEESPQSQLLFENIIKGNVAMQNTDKLIGLIQKYAHQNPADYYAPFYLVAADYINAKDYEHLELLLRSYFRAVGKDLFVFQEMIKFTLSRRDPEAFKIVQDVYLEVHPDDSRALQWLQNLYGAAQGQQPQQ
ncbi:MAG TPA: DUF2723 domain-containing protein [candidate division Zixibacteria bacterium]|nr:DUF2723 domain-containing protein [candidate division Zixibacteria bacterium]